MWILKFESFDCATNHCNIYHTNRLFQSDEIDLAHSILWHVFQCMDSVLIYQINELFFIEKKNNGFLKECVLLTKFLEPRLFQHKICFVFEKSGIICKLIYYYINSTDTTSTICFQIWYQLIIFYTSDRTCNNE